MTHNDSVVEFITTGEKETPKKSRLGGRQSRDLGTGDSPGTWLEVHSDDQSFVYPSCVHTFYSTLTPRCHFFPPEVSVRAPAQLPEARYKAPALVVDLAREHPHRYQTPMLNHQHSSGCN